MIHYDNLASSIQNYTPNMHTYVYIHISMYRKDVYGIILLEVVFSKSLESFGYVMKQSELFGRRPPT